METFKNKFTMPIRILFIVNLIFNALLFLRFITNIPLIPVFVTPAPIAIVLHLIIVVLAYIYGEEIGQKGFIWALTIFFVPYLASPIALAFRPFGPKVISFLFFLIANTPLLILICLKPYRYENQPRPITEPYTTNQSQSDYYNTQNNQYYRNNIGNADSSSHSSVFGSATQQLPGNQCVRCGKKLQEMTGSGVMIGNDIMSMIGDSPYNCKTCGIPYCVDCMTKLRKNAGCGICPRCGEDIGW
jgi:hypothetical protein